MTSKRILNNEAEARRFCREIMSVSTKPRLLWVVARNKYNDDNTLTSGTQSLERKVLYFDRENAEETFLRFLRKVEVLAEGEFYRDKKDENVVIDPSWIVVYMSAYALDEDDAADHFMTQVLDRRRCHRRAVTNQKLHPQPLSHISTLLETSLRKSPCRERRMLKLDVDTKDPDLLKKLFESMKGTKVILAAETRGGYHVIIERGPACQNLFAFAKSVNAGVESADHWITLETNDGPMFAVPGTKQGGFTVRLATDFWRQAVNGRPER